MVRPAACCRLSPRTWQVQEDHLQHNRVQAIQGGAEEEHGPAHGAHDAVEQVEDLLSGPTILRNPQLDANELDLHVQGARG